MSTWGFRVDLTPPWSKEYRWQDYFDRPPEYYVVEGLRDECTLERQACGLAGCLWKGQVMRYVCAKQKGLPTEGIITVDDEFASWIYQELSAAYDRLQAEGKLVVYAEAPQTADAIDRRQTDQMVSLAEFLADWGARNEEQFLAWYKVPGIETGDVQKKLDRYRKAVAQYQVPGDHPAERLAALNELLPIGPPQLRARAEQALLRVPYAKLAPARHLWWYILSARAIATDDVWADLRLLSATYSWENLYRMAHAAQGKTMPPADPYNVETAFDRIQFADDLRYQALRALIGQDFPWKKGSRVIPVGEQKVAVKIRPFEYRALVYLRGYKEAGS